jgi:serine/threonine-protein kinase RsbW
MLLAQVVDHTELHCRFTLAPPTLIVEVTAPTRDGRVPARDTFAWTVLSALAGEVTATVDSDQHLTITLRKTAEGAA